MGDEHAISDNYFHEIVVHASDSGVTCASRVFLSVSSLSEKNPFALQMLVATGRTAAFA